MQWYLLTTSLQSQKWVRASLLTPSLKVSRHIHLIGSFTRQFAISNPPPSSLRLEIMIKLTSVVYWGLWSEVNGLSHSTTQFPDRLWDSIKISLKQNFYLSETINVCLIKRPWWINSWNAQIECFNKYFWGLFWGFCFCFIT